MAERKKYIEVSIPLLGSSMRVLGTSQNLPGKTIKLDLSRKLRGRGLTITFQITSHEEKLLAIPKRQELVKSYIRKMLRKRISYVEDSFSINCLDLKATIKPFLITRKRVSRAVRKNLRNTAKEFIQEYCKEREYNEICIDLLNGTMQKMMLPKLKKVYPLSFCEIRVFETKELSNLDTSKIAEIKNQASKEDETEEIQEEVQEEEKVEELVEEKEDLEQEESEEKEDD